MLRIVSSTNRRAVAALLSATGIRDRATESRASEIVQRVRRNGDSALRRYARTLDGHDGPLEISRPKWERESAGLPQDVRRAIRRAARNIRSVARRQVPKGWRHRVAPGIDVEQRVIPLARVGCYVPAGRYPLPSSLLMAAIPARVAGVREIVVCCPHPDAAVFAAAIEAGVDRLFQIGGAHAVGAMAYGTATVPRVDKIVGPGNRWVAAAKRQVVGQVGIDMIAGPTEVLIVADGTASPGRIAADMIAQAEHDEDATSWCVTTDPAIADALPGALEAALSAAPRAAIA